MTLTKLLAVFVIFCSGTTMSFGQRPTASFTGSPLAGCSPLIVVFQDQSTGNPNSWIWDFGNGNTSTLQNPTATYFNPGTYTVSLTATNAAGTNTLTRTQYVTVYEPPTVNFSADNVNGCFPHKVQFTDLSTPGAGNNNVSWQWDFGNGITSTLQNPAIIYTTAGFYSVTLKVTNDKGCSKTLSRPNFITITPGVKAGFTNTQPTVCSVPSDITFTNTSTGPGTLSYLWDFGDGNFSGLTNPVHTYNTSGSYIITLVTMSTAGCTDTFRTTVPLVIGGFTTSFTSPAAICANEQISFTNTSVPLPIGASWNFGDGNQATGINATHIYATPGSYTVWLYDTFATCIDSISSLITVNPQPIPDFTAPVTSRCQPPLTVNFQDISTGGATGWQWDFGDGGTSALQNPTHTYNSYGSFTVTLIVTNGLGCSDAIIKTDYVRVQRAIISIPDLPAHGCIPFTITPVANITAVDAITSYDWDFGDGGTSTLANPTYTYSVQGTYDVRLIITTSTGCRDTLKMIAAVRVGSKPVADFSAAPIPVCAHQPVFFTDLSAPADQWEWDFGDGATSFVQNPSHLFNDTGFFTIRLIASNNGCPDTMTKTNHVYVLPPIARFTSAANCSNKLQFSFTDQSIAPLTWDWNFGDGSPHSALPSPVHTFPALGAYTVTLIVTNGTCADTLTKTINAIDQVPDFLGSVTTMCRGTLIVFIPSGYNPALTASFLWDFGDGTQLNTTTSPVVYQYPNSGTYSVSLVVTDINGCTDAVIKNNYIRVNGARASFTGTNLSGCKGLTTTFNDLSTTDGVNNIVNWRWDFGDGTIQNFSAPPFQHTYNTTGVFSIKLTITDAAGCVDSTSALSYVTTTDPVPDFISNTRLTCPGGTIVFNTTSTPINASTTWDFGDGGTSTNPYPIYVYATAGLYTVKLVIQDPVGCKDSIIRNQFIRVDVPVPGFTASDTASSCTPLEVQFTNTSTYYESILWDFGPGEGTSILPNPVHYYSLPGIYPVKLIVTSPGGCKDSITKTITVFDTAGARVNYLPLAGCKPLSLSLNSFSQGPMASYFWDFGDGYTQTTTTPTVNHIYNSFGSFVPKVILNDPAGCPIPVEGLDTVIVTGANVNFGYDKYLFCDRGFVSFTDSTTFNDPVVTFNWFFGDGGTSTTQNPSHQYNTPGLYDISLVVQTQAGCRDTLTKLAAIKIVQRPITNIGGDTIVCVGSPLLHLGVFAVPDTSVVTWSWNFPNGNTSIQQNPLAQTYTTAGNFTVTSIVTNSTGCKDTTQQTIHINPLPVVTMPGQITAQSGFPVTIPATYSPNTLTWIWSPSDGLSCTTCPAPDAGPKFNTTYQVYFTDDKGCSNTGKVEVIVICKNANLFVPNTFSPNGDGSNDKFYPRGKGLERVKSLRVFNRWGEVVFEKREFPVNDANSGWDGTFKGKKPQADVYVYQIEVFCENGDIIRLNGNIALIL